MAVTILLIVCTVLMLLPLAFMLAVMIIPPRCLRKQPYGEDPTETSDHSKRAGNSWVRKSASGLWELYVEGSPFERGVKIGKLTTNLILLQEEVFFREVSKMVKSKTYLYFLKLLVAFMNRRLDRHIGKEYSEEIYGVSLSAPKEFGFVGPPYQRYLNYHAAHDIGHTLQSFHLVGCTAFSAWGSRTEDGKILTGRNFDFYLGDDFSREKIVMFCRPETGYRYAAITWGGMIGCTSGMNEHGLCVTVNGANSEFPNRSATPVSILIREVLQYALNISEALVIINNKRIFVSESLMISSAADHKTVIAEKSKSRTVLLESDTDQLICTNHFMSPELRDDPSNRKYMEESPSVYRYQRVEELMAQCPVVSVHDIACMLRDKKGLQGEVLGMGNEKAIDQLLAHHSIIFKPEERIFWISCGPYQEGAYQAYDLKEIFSKGKDADEKNEICRADLTIPEDAFLKSDDYKEYVIYKSLMAEFVAGKIATDEINEKVNTFIASNPEMHTVYSTLGNYFYKREAWESAATYYETGLSKHIPNRNESLHMEKQLKKVKLKIGSARSGHPGGTV